MFKQPARYFVWSTLFLVIAIVVASLSAGFAFRSVDASPNAQTETLRTINVSGQGIVQVAPDVVYVTIGVESLNPDVQIAVDDVNGRIANVTDALLATGIAQEDIRTEMFNIYQESYGPFEGTTTPNYSFRVMIYLNVKVHNVDNIGDILSTAINAGANAINNIQFGVEDTATFESEARLMALKDAESRANEIADAQSLTITGIQQISDYGGGLNGFSGEKFGLGGGGGGGFDVGSVPISAGTLTFNISVNVTYTFE